jgi:cytoskeletal protein CcmA (bactofilin family)
MFGKGQDKKQMDEIVKSSTIIGKGTTIEGNVDTMGNISVDGKLIGNLRTKSRLNLGVSAEVEGNIMAQNAELAGHITGCVEVTDLLVLKPTAIIDGDINANKLKVEEGAIINGNCKMGAIVKDLNGVEEVETIEQKEKSA